MTQKPPRRLTHRQAQFGKRVLEEMRGQSSLEGAKIMGMFLEGWKKDHCEALGHPLEIREGYALFCACGARFGAVTEDPGEQEG